MSSIYFLLDQNNPIGFLHKNRSDIVHYYHIGAPIRYWLLSEKGELEETVLGPDILAGQQLQLLVKGGEWKASELLFGDFSLISEAVAPGFEYQDNDLATPEWLTTQPTKIQEKLKKFVKMGSGLI